MAKKDFKSASELFLSIPGEAEATPEPKQIRANASKPLKDKKTPEGEQIGKAAEAFNLPTGYVLVKEAKTERLQVLIRPTTNKLLSDKAKQKGISKNELINQILEK